MEPRYARLIGATLMAGAVAGLALGLLGLVLVWAGEGLITRRTEDGAATARRALDATDRLLVAADDTLLRAQDQLRNVEQALDSVGTSLDGTVTATRAFGRLAGGDVAQVIRDTRTSLQSLARSAGLVDTTLGVLSDLPLVGGARYRPAVPLAESIRRVDESLLPVPGQLALMDLSLRQTADGVAAVRSDLTAVAGDLGGVEESLAAARTGIADYRDTVAELDRQLDRAQRDARRLTRLGALAVTLFVLWLAIAQLGLLTQGYEWWLRGAPGGPADGA